jgi:hypothetical protein
LCDDRDHAKTHTDKEHVCSYCGGSGHRGNFRLNRKRRTRRAPHRTQRINCTTCGRPGHTAEKHVCVKCHSFRHRVRDCPSVNEWTHDGHYPGGYCGQSCSCCRYAAKKRVAGAAAAADECQVCAALDGH